MILTVIDLLTNLKDLLYWTLILSYRIGHGIFYLLKTVLSAATVILEQSSNVLKVLLEDFSVFLIDFCDKLNVIFSGICGIFLGLTNGVKFVINTLKCLCENVIYNAELLWGATVHIIISVFYLIGDLLVAVKQFLILLGSGTWFALMLVPNSIYYSLIFCVASIKMVAIGIIDSITTHFIPFLELCCKFVTDVPYEAALSLILLFCGVYVFIRRFRQVCAFLRRFYVSSRQYALWFILTVKNKVAYTMRRRVYETSESENEESDSEYGNDTSENVYRKPNSEELRYCVVCQERDKCILILPCKHVCLCSECNLRLRSYNRICPICRSDVHRTMKIFI